MISLSVSCIARPSRGGASGDRMRECVRRAPARRPADHLRLAAAWPPKPTREWQVLTRHAGGRTGARIPGTWLLSMGHRAGRARHLGILRSARRHDAPTARFDPIRLIPASVIKPPHNWSRGTCLQRGTGKTRTAMWRLSRFLSAPNNDNFAREERRCQAPIKTQVVHVTGLDSGLCITVLRSSNWAGRIRTSRFLARMVPAERRQAKQTPQFQ